MPKKTKPTFPLGSDYPRTAHDTISTDITMNRVQLEVRKFVCERRFDDEAFYGNLDVTRLQDEACRQMILRVLLKVASKKLDVKTVRFPATWWDAFKRHWFPAKWLIKYPVKYTEVTMEASAYHPDIAIPDHASFVDIVVRSKADGY